MELTRNMYMANFFCFALFFFSTRLIPLFFMLWYLFSCSALCTKAMQDSIFQVFEWEMGLNLVIEKKKKKKKFWHAFSKFYIQRLC